MKQELLLLVCTLLLSTTAFAVSSRASSDTKLTPEERATAIKLLHESEREFLGLVENLTDEQWDFKPSPFKWSVGQTAEHIALAEGLLFGVVQQALASKPNPDWETKTTGKEVVLEKILAARTGRAQSPAAIQPINKKMSRAEITTLFREGRARSLKFIQTTDASFKDHTFDNPFPVFGTLNAYQWFLYIPQHNSRHNKQIAEVKANPNFPK
ncbi:MAG TPA: DinB family protein [Blastocatellia bacterium]|nr:DinB family protein [Blastocatellia bacterium]